MTESDWSRLDPSTLSEAITAFAGLDTPVHTDLVARLAEAFTIVGRTGEVEDCRGQVDEKTAQLLDFLVQLEDSSLGDGDDRERLRRTSSDLLPEIMAATAENNYPTAPTRVAKVDVPANHVTDFVTGTVVQTGQLDVVQLDRFHLRSPEQLPVPAQLPVPIRRLVGQQHVLAALDEVLEAMTDEPAVVVIAGARGSGKSTVAVHWLRQHSDRFPDGQLRAPLGAWTDSSVAPAEVLAGFITSLGVDRADVPAELEQRVNLFRSLTEGRSLQILLDDAVSAAQVRCLLPGRGRSMVVVTGHGGLGALAEYGTTFVDVEPFESDYAIHLLRGYVGDRIDAEPGARDRVIELCGGRALALSVVGRVLRDVPDLSISALLEELLPVDATRPRVEGAPSIARVLDACYRRLSDLAQRCYRVLGLHVGNGGLSLPAVAAVMGVSERVLRPAVRELVHGKRMVEQVDGRLLLDALTGEHARNLAFDIDGDEVCDRTRRAFVRWYSIGALTADSVLHPHRPWARRLFPAEIVAADHPAYLDAREWMLAERVSLRATVELASELGEYDAVLRLCVAQWWLYESQLHVDDLIATHDLGIACADRLGHLIAKTLLLVQKGHVERTRSRFGEAAALFAQAAGLARAQGSLELEVAAVEGEGLARFDRGDHREASGLLRLNVELARRTGDSRRLSLAYLHAAKTSEPEEALRLLAEAWSGFCRLDQPDQHMLAQVLYWQGCKLSARGDHAAARTQLERALAMAEELRLNLVRAQVLHALGDVVLAADRAESVRYYLQAARTYEESGLLVRAAETWRRVARLE